MDKPTTPPTYTDKELLTTIQQLKADYKATLQPRKTPRGPGAGKDKIKTIKAGTEDNPITSWQVVTLFFWLLRWKVTQIYRCNDPECIVNLTKGKAFDLIAKLAPVKEANKAAIQAHEAEIKRINKELTKLAKEGKLFDD